MNCGLGQVDYFISIKRLTGQPALGVPAPSTSDVQLFKGLVQNLGLREVWITNGM